ncbi:MAG: glycosyltransferase family 2 protein [bacterium]
MKQQLVSIVISVFRRPDYLAAAIRSALDQTWVETEIVVAEDGGSDCASGIVASFLQPDTKLRLIRQSHNVGAAANKLAAWREARGEYIVNLDDDDLLEPGFVEALLPPLLSDSSLVLSFCDHFIVDSRGRIDSPATEENTRIWKRGNLSPGAHRPFLRQGLVDRSIPFAMGALWCRTRLDLNDFRIEAGPSYDLFMTYVAARTGLGAYYIPRRLTKYRVHPGMETRTGSERIHRANIFINKRFIADPALAEWRHVFVARLSEAYAGLGVVKLRARHRWGAGMNFLKSIWTRPTRRALVGFVRCGFPNGPERVY